MTSVSSNGSLRAYITDLPTGDCAGVAAFYSNTKDNSAKALLTFTVVGQQACELYAGSFNNFPTDTDLRIWLDATGSDVHIGQAASLGWWWLAWVRVSGVLSLYYKTDAASSWTLLSAGTHTGTSLRLDLFAWNDGSTDGASSTEALCCIKVWGAAKDPTTVLLPETRRSTVGDTSNLWAFHPFQSHTALGDTSGNSRTINTTGTGSTFGSQPAFLDDSALSISPNATKSESRSYGATLQHGAQAIAPNATPTTSRSYGSTVSLNLEIAPNLTRSESRSYASSVSHGAQAIAPSVTKSESKSYGPTLTQGLNIFPNATPTTSKSYPVTISHGAQTIAPNLTPTTSRSFAASVNVVGGTQTTCLDPGHTFGWKRGTAASLDTFLPTGTAWTYYVRFRVSNWVNASATAAANIALINADGATGESNSGASQLYYNVSTGEIRLWQGEAGWAGYEDDQNVISGSYSGWATLAWACEGGASDPIKMYVIRDDSNVFQLARTLPPGGKLRQIIFGGITGEDPWNVRNTTGIVFKNKALTPEEILLQRQSPTPLWTGANLFAFLHLFDDGAANNQKGLDKSALYGGTGGNDFEIFEPEQITYPSDVPSWYTNPTIVPEPGRSESRSFAATVSLSTSILPNTTKSESRSYGATLSQVAAIAPASTPSESRSYGATVQPGAQAISPNATPTTSRSFAGSVQNGAQTIAPNATPSTSQSYGPTLQHGAQVIAPDFTKSESRSYGPTMQAGIFIFPNLTASESRSYPPALATGPVTIAPVLTTSESRSFGPSLQTVHTLAPACSPGTSRSYAATLDLGFAIAPNTTKSESRSYAPTIASGAVTCSPNFTPSESRSYPATIFEGEILSRPSPRGRVSFEDLSPVRFKISGGS